ncbi:MAG: hypothetical protein C0398_04200 [Coprothermobacter sp.]|nr:hypothetical protein [Coprothermobacter sp.]
MKYNRNYLASVVVRVDFLVPVIDLNKPLPPKLQNAIIQNFPVPERREVQMQIGPMFVPPNSGPRNVVALDFYNGPRTRHLGIGPDFLFIEEIRYSDYETLRSSLLSAMNELVTSPSEHPATKRIGLRYVNVIPAPGNDPFDWHGYISSELLSPILYAAKSQAGLCRGMTYLEFNDSDARFIVHYGMQNQDYPAPIRRKEFTLDLDSFVTGVVDYQQLPDTLDVLHSRIIDTFESSILKNLRSVMAKNA